ncbi:autophagy-related protein 13, partial [Tremellales sp. Uapishka_1]
MASSSASSSQVQPSREDQVLHRFYLKTIEVLVEGRLTHYGGAPSGGKEGKRDKWFNLSLPETDLHKNDLLLYKSISSYSPYTPIPPLLVAFILDTSDIPSGQALMWGRTDGRVRLDLGIGNGKGKERERKNGILLERWTFQARTPPDDQASVPLLPALTAYRMGIIHFRALYSLVRLLPAYRLYRRLRRANNGLKVGIKLWTPEMASPEAWDVMEGGLIGMDTSLETLAHGDVIDEEDIAKYTLAKLDLFGNQYELSVDYRQEVDFGTEDMESALSEKFEADVEEDWFRPTVHRYNTSNPSPIPQRQMPMNVGPGSAGLSSTRPERKLSGLTPGSAKRPASSLGTEKWGMLAEGLPFAASAGAGASMTSTDGKVEPTSPSIASGPSGSATVARRLSAHSIGPFKTLSASPSTSILRGPLPQNLPINQPQRHVSGSRPGSIGRTSSFLSQSGRSFTHAQMANMHPSSSSPTYHDSSPPVQTPVSPSSLSFSKQPFPRSLSGRPVYQHASPSSPFIPSSLERENSIPNIKRYSSSLTQRQGRLAGSAGSQGSSGDGTSPGGLLRQTSGRESGLRNSVENPTSRIATMTPASDDDDIQAFLKTLESLPQPPSLAAQNAVSRSHLPSTSSSLSAATPSSGEGKDRQPLTRRQVDEALQKMKGSFTTRIESDVLTRSSMSSSQRESNTSASQSAIGGSSQYGLLTASRPTPAARRIPSTNSPPSLGFGLGNRVSSAKNGSPLSANPTTAPHKASHPHARSLPGQTLLQQPESSGPHAATLTGPNILSPQTTGGTGTDSNSNTSRRRGPVLLRGGFGNQPSTSPSPSHSPIRDFMGNRYSKPSTAMSGERLAEEELKKHGKLVRTTGTAPSSLGGNVVEDEREREYEWDAGRGRPGRVVSEGGVGVGAGSQHEDGEESVGVLGRMDN